MRTATILALPLAAIAAVVPNVDSQLSVRQAGDCLINREHRGSSWTENGFIRRRIHFSTENSDPAIFCEWWLGPTFDLHNNLQCYVHPEEGWAVDISFGATALGDYQFGEALIDRMNWWRERTQCATG